MIDSDIREAIRILESLFDKNFKWALAGSVNLVLHGMKFNPNDIDVIIPYEDMEKTKKKLTDFEVSEIKEMENFIGEPSWEFFARINGKKIHFFGGRKGEIYVSKLLDGKTEIISLGDFEIPCLSLEAEKQAYQEIGRLEKVKSIEEFL